MSRLALTARYLRLHVLLPRDLTLSEHTMTKPRSWTVTRGWISHLGAQRQWDRAYQMVLHMAAKRPNEIAIGRGKKLVDVRKVYFGGQVY